VEAHRRLMNLRLRSIPTLGRIGALPLSAEYASRIVNLGPSGSSTGPWETYTQDQIDARYVLAWNALHVGKDRAFPEEALTHLDASKEAQMKAGENPPTPRWRAVALEAAALGIQAGLLPRKSDQIPGAKKAALEKLNRDMPAWIARAEEE